MLPRRWHGFRNPWEREYAMRGGLWRGEADASFLAPFLDPGQWALELGCGDGKFLRALQTLHPRVVGLDFSRRALRIARERQARTLACADITTLPFAHGKFGFVASRYVIGALTRVQRESACTEIQRVLAPGGTLFVEEFSTDDFRHGKGMEIEPRTFERNRGILTHYFEPDEALAMFPGMKLIDASTLRTSQRTDEGQKERVRLRWILQTPPKASNR